MDKKLSRILEPGFSLYFIILLFFAGISAVYSIKLSLFQLFVCGVLYVFYLRSTAKRKKDILKYLEKVSGNLDSAAKDSITNFPMPVSVALVSTGQIIWCNDLFNEATDSEEHFFEKRLTDIVPGFDNRWLLEGKGAYPTEIKIGERYYQVYGNLVRPSGPETGVLMTLYWLDCTNYVNLREMYRISRPVISIISIDNYEELVKNATDSEKSTMLAEIDRKIGEWSEHINGILRRFDRDKYFFVLEEQDLVFLTQEKFSILESVRQIQSRDGINATLSIGIGKDGETLNEKYRFASLALEMALSRGGDQVVIKNRYAFEFFGGLSKEVEKRTKVKSRVMANALGQLIRDSSQVLIMGHTMSDIDSVGAAVGMACAVKSREKPFKIVLDRKKTLAKPLLDRIDAVDEMKNIFVDPEEAMLIADSNTLLIVVDTNRPDYVESPPLLQSINKVAVIDHHRRAAQYIENCAVNMHEPYASSASELVAELLQYMVPNRTILRIEAECLLAGIYLDTKGFSIKAGVRTFEAAAYLKRAGADTVEVKKLFQNTYDAYMVRQRIVSCAKVIRNDIVLAVADFEADRAVAAQACDELLNIMGMSASIVVFRSGDDAIVSARSLGKINVQIIMEKMNGGGNLSAAGAQLSGVSVSTTERYILSAVEEYFEENPQEKS